jgi:acetyl-CoA carboxylase biotin carboxylase subunit
LAFSGCNKKRILVANRGEIAIRIMRSIQELGHTAVAVYSDIDKYAPHVSFADEAYHIGESEALKSYLNIDRIIETAKKVQVDAIHPGYGFLAENPLFAENVQSSNIIWIGPNPEAMYRVGDKIRARKLAEETGVPVVPGRLLDNNVEPLSAAAELGYPVLIKASAGGGGKGMRIVRDEVELLSSINLAKKEAHASFADPTVYLEKYIEEPHHIEIQILADQFGNYYYFPERECSIQRRYQKIVEESPSSFIDRDKAKTLGLSAINLMKKAEYTSAGTVEFLVDKNRNFYFLEVNARIQVEHPITEEITGVDLVSNQIKQAFGEKVIFNQDILNNPKGHSIEARIYAEDSENNFIPSVGKIEFYREPSLLNVRIDSGATKGTEIPIYYDPIISKVVAKGENRKQSLQKLYLALSNYHIYPIKTTAAFIMNIIKHPDFKNGGYDTNFINKHFNELLEVQEEEIPLAIACHYFLSSQGFMTGGNLTHEKILLNCWESLQGFRG